jgi:iron complex outermembrane receptor protein
VSDNERRTSDALDISARGSVRAGGLVHQLQAGLLVTRFTGRFQDQIFDLAGTGRIDGALQAAPSYGSTDANTDRDERSTEWSLRDVVRLAAWQLGRACATCSSTAQAGARARPPTACAPRGCSSRPPRRGSPSPTTWRRAASCTRAGARGWKPKWRPTAPATANAGQPLPALRSRQLELGWKHAAGNGTVSVAAFDIDRPLSADVGEPATRRAAAPRAVDGSAHHRGLEAQATLRSGPWRWNAGPMLLDAQRRGAQDASLNGTRPVNVPAATLRLGALRRFGAGGPLPGLELGAQLVAEGDPRGAALRPVGPHPGLAPRRPERALAHAGRCHPLAVARRAGRRPPTAAPGARRPARLGHAYLFPLQPRTWRLGVQADL